jgi:NADH-quinone oxidoreductase subunit J
MASNPWFQIWSVASVSLAQAAPAAAAREADSSLSWSTLAPYLLPAAMALVAAGVWLMLSRAGRRGRLAGGVIAIAGFVLLGLEQAAVGGWLVSVLYWVMAGVTVIAAGATISARSPVYSAVFFAVTLLGAAGLFLLSGAQFLSIATVAVYAGAIVVTFLFVVMLAQPEGRAYYDRLSWGQYPPLAAAVAGALLIGGVAYLSGELGAISPPYADAENPVLAKNHMAHLGRELFSVHLLSVEIAGTLLLIALVGAIAMVVQGRDPVIRRPEPAVEDTERGAQRDRAGARQLEPVGGNGRE